MATTTTPTPTEVPAYQAALLKLAVKLTEQAGKTDTDTAAMEALIATRFEKNTALYRKEGAIIAEMLAVRSDGLAKPVTEEALHTELSLAPYKVQMSLSRFNRAHRLHKAFVGLTAEQATAKLDEYKAKRAEDESSLDIKSLVSFVANTGTRNVPTAEQMVNRHRKGVTGSLVDFTGFDDGMLEALVKQIRAEQAFRTWCDENPQDSAAIAHRNAILTGVAAAKAQRAASVGTGV